MTKIYWALVLGTPKKEEGKVDIPLKTVFDENDKKVVMLAKDDERT